MPVEPCPHPPVRAIPHVVDRGALGAGQRAGDLAARPTVFGCVDGVEVGEVGARTGGQPVIVLLLIADVGRPLQQTLQLAGVVR